MKRGFTLLEIIIVIIIIGILATLGFTQYSKMVERSRGAEARAICGDIRKFAAAYRLEFGSMTSITLGNVNIGGGADQIPNACKATHYFSYTAAQTGADSVSIVATRCNAGGKPRQLDRPSDRRPPRLLPYVPDASEEAWLNPWVGHVPDISLYHDQGSE